MTAIDAWGDTAFEVKFSDISDKGIDGSTVLFSANNCATLKQTFYCQKSMYVKYTDYDPIFLMWVGSVTLVCICAGSRTRPCILN